MNRLYRSRDDRMLAGVAGGLADYWDADPSLIRVLWAVLVPLTGGIALFVYIVMAIVVPEESQYPIASAPAAPPGAPVASQPPTNIAADPREARRAARAARRAERRENWGNTGPVLIGAFLVILGAFFLVREWLPEIDFDWVWPAALIFIGVAVLLASLRRDEGSHRDEDRGGVR